MPKGPVHDAIIRVCWAHKNGKGDEGQTLTEEVADGGVEPAVSWLR